MDDIVKKEQQLLPLQTLLNEFKLTYDPKNKTLLIDLPKDLKIGFLNNLDIYTRGDLNIDSKGEISLITRRKNINLDSLGAKIYLNSFRSKPIRNVSRYAKKRKNQLALSRNTSKEQSNHEHNIFDQIYEAISLLNERITSIEQKIK